MRNKTKLTIDLLSAISGVLIFLTLAHFIDNGIWPGWGVIMFVAGVALLYWNEPFANWIPLTWVRYPLILTISHVLIFLGIKTYLTQHLGQYWWIVGIVGVILLNNNRFIAEKMFRGN